MDGFEVGMADFRWVSCRWVCVLMDASYTLKRRHGGSPSYVRSGAGVELDLRTFLALAGGRGDPTIFEDIHGVDGLGHVIC